MPTSKPPSIWLSLIRPAEYRRRMDEQWAQLDAELQAARRRAHIRQAEAQITDLKRRLEPEYRQTLTEALAQWEAHLDALLDDGVHALTKGHE